MTGFQPKSSTKTSAYFFKQKNQALYAYKRYAYKTCKLAFKII